MLSFISALLQVAVWCAHRDLRDRVSSCWQLSAVSRDCGPTATEGNWYICVHCWFINLIIYYSIYSWDVHLCLLLFILLFIHLCVFNLYYYSIYSSCMYSYLLFHLFILCLFVLIIIPFIHLIFYFIFLLVYLWVYWLEIVQCKIFLHSVL